MNDFLPQGYETPETPSHYMELEEGPNAFRILSSAIVGYEWWVDAAEHGRKPIRVRTADEVPEEVKHATENRARAKHFECTGNEFRPKVARDEGLWVQGILRPW